MDTIIKDIDQIYLVIDSMTDLVRVVNEDGIVLLANKAMIEAVGGCVGRKCFRCLSLTERCADCLSIRASRGEHSLETERHIGERIYSVKAEPVYDADGGYVGVVEVFRDSTDMVRLRTQIMESNDRMMRDMQMARAMQNTILRTAMPNINGYRLSIRFHPCNHVGGDMFEAARMTDGRTLMFISDVSGHGVQAAMLTVFLRSEVASAARRTANIAELAQMLTEAFRELGLGSEVFITAFLAALDAESGELECMNMGHSVPPLIADDRGVREIRQAGLPICSWSALHEREIRKETILKGGRIMLYTDGLFDTQEALKEIKTKFGKEEFDSDAFLDEYEEQADGCKDDVLMAIIERLK